MCRRAGLPGPLALLVAGLGCLLKSRCVGVEAMDTTGLQPYMEISYPSPGAAFLLGEEDFYCTLTIYNLNASEAVKAVFSIEIMDEFKVKMSAAQGAVDGQTELQSDGSRVLSINLQGLRQGRYGFRTRFHVDSILLSLVDWHPFQVQRSLFAAPSPASREVAFPAGTPGEADRESEHTHQVVALVRIRNCARAVQHFLRALSYFVHQVVVLDDGSIDDTAKAVQEVASECRVARILAKGARRIEEADPWGDMEALLLEGRKLGGTHFVVVHGDELFSTSMLMDGTWWRAMRALDIGESLCGGWRASDAALACAWLGLPQRRQRALALLVPALRTCDASAWWLTVPWIHFWKSLRYARADWMMQARRPAPSACVVCEEAPCRCRQEETGGGRCRQEEAVAGRRRQEEAVAGGRRQEEGVEGGRRRTATP